MSYREWYENLLGKFGSLNEYIDDIHARRVGRDAILVQVGLEREENLKMEAVLKWISARMGIIGRSRVLELKSALFTGILPIARAVDIKHEEYVLRATRMGFRSWLARGTIAACRMPNSLSGLSLDRYRKDKPFLRRPI
ncbi:hypothetical protein N7471_013385 [Penicillium samsonianum]|uniref:uncharacterized protein n=1 Tax=Penicillium samsonianum TaxID=1882272 RepID=UPI00254804CC|nr:uncharacterized protein N7471_013385 [Penicillium samsonianum]KAJ6118765.1 hypothetical protein N7471_013385 [Penicillium samsonianum]